MKEEKGLKHKTLSGIIWMLFSNGGQQFVSFLVMLVLARKLGPAAFGLIGIASVLIDVLSIVGRAGLTEVLIQKKNSSDKDLSTAFWTSLSFGALLSALILVSSPLIARLFAEPELESVLGYLAVICFLNTLGTVHEAVLRLSFGFKALAIRNITASLVSGLCSVALVLSGFGVMSLVAQRIIATVWLTAALWISVRWRPALFFSRETCRRDLAMGSAIMGSSLLSTGNQRIIDLIVGFFLGTMALGFLRIAWRGLDLLLNVCIAPISSVVFSSFSHLQDDKKAMARAYEKLIQLTAFFLYPVFLGSAIIAPEFIELAFGSQWSKSAELMQLMTLMAFFVPLTYFRGNILLAGGHTRQVLRLSLIAFVTSLVVCVITSKISLEAAAFGNTVRVALVTFINWNYVQGYTGTTTRSTLEKVFPPFVATLLMVLCLVPLRTALLEQIPMWQATAAVVLAGGALYSLALWLFFRPYCREIADFLIHKKKSEASFFPPSNGP